MMMVCQPTSTLTICRNLVRHFVVVIGFMHALEPWWSILPFTSRGGFGCSKCRCRRRRTSGDSSGLRRIGLMLVMLMRVIRPGRRCPIICKRSYLRWRTVSASIRRHWTRSSMTAIWRKAHVGTWTTIIRIGNTIWGRRLGSRWRWLRQTLRPTIRAWSNMIQGRWRGGTPDGSVPMLLAILHHLLLPRTDLPGRWGRSDGLTLIVRVWGLRLRLRMLNFRQTSTPILGGTSRSRAWSLRHWRRTRCAPLRAWRSSNASCLVQLGVHILRNWCAMHACGLSITTEQLESSLDVDIGRIKVSCSLVGIQRICGLIVTRLVLDTVSLDHGT